ncbi:DUF3800 domain-containing protein [Methylobacterium phyllosphaerae]
MYLLYLDDSGDVDDPNINHFVLGGVAVFERQIHWLDQELNSIAARFDPANPHIVELHGNPMLQGNKGWKSFPQSERISAMQDCLRAFTRIPQSNVAFAIVIEKGSVKDVDPVEHAFEMLINRFDLFLRKRFQQGDPQRGLLVMDESSYEKRFQGLARNFKTQGHRWGQLRNLAEVPLFVDSRATRLIQLADIVSYSIFRNFEKKDDRFLPIIKDRFVIDRSGSTLIEWLLPPKQRPQALGLARSEHSTTVTKNGSTSTVTVVEEAVLIASNEKATNRGE